MSLTFIFFIQTIINDKYPGQSDDVWDWFLPQVFPTLALMIGVLVSVIQLPSDQLPSVDWFYYRFALYAIIVYFIALLLVVLSAPLDFITNGTSAFDHLKKSTKFLSALQSVVTLILGVFFFRGERPTS